jgi:hypothetical protein
MKHKAVKLGLTGLVLAMAFGGLLYSTMIEGAEYYKSLPIGTARSCNSTASSSRTPSW